MSSDCRLRPVYTRAILASNRVIQQNRLVYLLLQALHTMVVQVYTHLQPDKVPSATIARIRTCPIPEQPFPHKFTDKTAEGCQVSNYQHDYNIFSS